MSYRELYHYCQNLKTPISRRDLIAKVCHLTGKVKPRVIHHGLNPEIVRGFFIVAENSEHPFARWAYAPGGGIIVVAREMTYCWHRLVVVKELMHLFDEPLELVGEAEIFQTLVSEFVAPTPDRSEAFRSEAQALWMALGALCPEQRRQEYARMRTAGEIDDMAIAQALKIPVRYVPHLFHDAFRRIVDSVQ